MARLGDIMKYDYGFIGAGNMGSALSKALKGPTVAVSNRTPEKAEALASAIGATATTNADIAANSRYIVLGVKPQMLPVLIDEIREDISPDAVLVTMAAGIKMSTLCEMVGREQSVIRIMPNTPVAAGAGNILVAKNSKVRSEDLETFISDFASAGELLEMDEDMIDAASVISGCGPAYSFMFFDALAKAGESLGLSYDMAKDLALSTVKGSAFFARKSDLSLDQLKVNVCSPGGSTIEGVKVFENENLDEIVTKALRAAYDRTLELSKGE
ncbi:MAG: pyrroline-5-carboxylate reductase [Clostridia bacterium]|nr:pyrroline-5-carboxylate reductase [Clostridia bacterium]